MKNPNHGSNPTTKEFDFKHRENLVLPFLSPDALQELRNAQHKLVLDAHQGISPFNVAALDQATLNAYDQFDDLADKYLADFDIADNDPNIPKYKKYLSNFGIDAIDDQKWLVGELEPDGTKKPDGSDNMNWVSGKKKATEKYDDFIDQIYEDNDARPDLPPPQKTPEEIKDIVDNDPTIKAARTNVSNLRAQLAKLSAKRQGKLWTGGKFKAEYDEVQSNYQEALNALVKLELIKEKEAGLERDEDAERLDAAFKLVQDFKSLQEQSVDILKNSPVGKFVTWMTKGGTFKRILKGATLGVLVGAAGAALSAFTLGIGGGAIAAGVATAATLSGRFARGYATFDNKDGRGMDVINADDANGTFNVETLKNSGAEGKKGEETVDLVGEHLMNKFEADTKAEQRKRRKSVAIAMGVVVAGSLLAEGANLGIDAFTHHIGGAHSLLFGSQDAHATSGAGAPTPEVTPPAPVEHIYSPEATTITPGEGWYQTFQDMGIPKQEWSQLLNNTGDQLHGIQVDGHPLAYQMNNGQWGIRMPSTGQMPQSALDIINHAHEQLTSTAPSVTSSIDSLTSPVDHSSIANVIHMDTIHPSDIAGNPQLEHLATVAPHLNAETFGQNLGLPRIDWYNLQDYIAQQVTSNNPVYRGVFDVTPSGYVEFVTNKIPDNTMADMLNHIPSRIRSNL